MKAHGGTQMAHKSDTALAEIVKAWDFKSKSLGTGRGWEAPPLPDLRKAILAKYPGVEFDDRKEWIAEDAPDDGTGQGAAQPSPQPPPQTVADVGKPTKLIGT